MYVCVSFNSRMFLLMSCLNHSVLHKAGRHMEDSMVAAYVALLLGYITMNNGASHIFLVLRLLFKLDACELYITVVYSSIQEYERQVKELLPEKKFTLMVVVLKKFYEFLKLTANVSNGYAHCTCSIVLMYFLS